MAWQSSGMNVGNGNNGDASQSSQPQGTEYTLQGVMRFLQTEWHRHERDRNAWEIERQEMRARIASLEGAARRTSKTQNGQNKYIRLLENAVKAERARNKSQPAEEGNEAPMDKKKNRLDSSYDERPKERPHNSFLDVDIADMKGPSKDNVGEAKNYMETSQQEFTYLMVSATNPTPPIGRQQEPIDEYDPQAYDPNGMRMEWHNMLPNRQKEMRAPGQQQQSVMLEHQPPPVLMNNMSLRNHNSQPPPAMRSAPDQQPLPENSINPEQWSASFQMSDPSVEDNITKVTHTYDNYGRATETQEVGPKETGTEAEGWDFNESAQFPEPESKPVPQRPDTDLFPSAQDLPKSPSRGPGSHRRKGSMSRRRSGEHDLSLASTSSQKTDGNFKVRFGLRGHLDAVRSVIFTGGGSPGEPEICTAGDDGAIKRWIIPARYENQAGLHNGNAGDLDIQSFFTHRGHTGSVMCLASWAPSTLANGGRAQGDGWVFSGGQDASVRVWERGRIDPKATLDGHTDAVWALCVLPATCGAVFGQNNNYGGADRILLVSGAADGTVRVWSVSTPPQLMSPQPQGSGSSTRRSGGRVRGNSVSSGTSFPTSPQPSLSSSTPFHHTLIHTLKRSNSDASPTSITPLSASGDTFVVAYSDAATIVYDTRTGEEVVAMASLETYDGTSKSGVNAIVATTSGLDGSLSFDSSRSLAEDESVVHGATGSTVDGIIITGHEDRFIRFFDANSGQCTYNMLAHPAAISALSLSPDGRELVSAGHDASLRFWSLEKRACTQEITSHRLMRGEGVCDVVWSQDGRWVVSGGGDGVVKVFAR